MSGAHQLATELRSGYVNGLFNVDDPGDGNPFSLTVSGGIATIASGTRKLPVQPDGVSLHVKATGTVILTTLDGVTVATLAADQMAHCVSSGDGDWVAKVMLAGSLDIEAQLDLVAKGPLTEAAFTSATSTAAAWRSYTSANGTVKVPASISVSTGITLPNVLGGIIEGLGNCEPEPPTSALLGPSSSFIYTGTRVASETLLTYTGQQFEMRNCNLWGATAAQVDAASVAKCPILLQVTKGASVGTGKALFHKCSFSYGAIGINSALIQGEANCDMMTFSECFFDKLDVGVRVNNGLGFDYDFFKPHIRHTPIFIDVKAGGHFSIKEGVLSGGVTPATILNFDPDEGAGFGPNGSSYCIEGLKLDSQAADSHIVNMTEGFNYYASIVCNRIHFPSDAWTNAAFTISGLTTCYVNHAKNLGPGMFSWDSGDGTFGIPYFEIDKSLLRFTSDATDLFDLTNSIGTCMVRVTNCVDSNNEEVDDVKDAITGRGVLLTGLG